MKIIFYVISAILILMGGVFALQGLMLLPSRVMYGKPEWIWIGGAMIVAGAVIGFFQMRRKKK